MSSHRGIRGGVRIFEYMPLTHESIASLADFQIQNLDHTVRLSVLLFLLTDRIPLYRESLAAFFLMLSGILIRCLHTDNLFILCPISLSLIEP